MTEALNPNRKMQVITAISYVTVQNVVYEGVELYEGCRIIIVPNAPMLLLLDNSDSPSIVEQLS